MEENNRQSTAIIKIAFFGPENTGETALAKKLAQHYTTISTSERSENNRQIAHRFAFCEYIILHEEAILDKEENGSQQESHFDLVILNNIVSAINKENPSGASSDNNLNFNQIKKELSNSQTPYITLTGSAEDCFNNTIKAINDLDHLINTGFTPADFVQIMEHGIPPETIQKHLDIFKKGMPLIILDRAASLGDGIIKLNEDDYKKLELLFDSRKSSLKLKKFVPASGAASRMFKFLSEFLNEFDVNEESINAYINRKKDTSLAVFLAGLEKYPFYEEIGTKLRKNYSNYKYWSKDLRDYYFIKILLSSKHLNFAGKPKGILPFHNYGTHIATPVEEHLQESAFYASSNKTAFLHFTISEEHQEAFENIIFKVKPKVQKESGVTINIKFSYQDKATDTIAVNADNQPFRNENGSLVFRPGGHGALIDNLNKLDADIVFIKNIDNVIQNHIRSISLYKKALAGVLLNLQEQLFHHLHILDSKTPTQIEIQTIVTFVKTELNGIVSDFEDFDFAKKVDYLKSILDRPIRVCGMVKNEGEPGGGPFWVKDNNGSISLQIVESSQINVNDQDQLAILKTATHFNPVDLVCGIKNYKGAKFDLNQFVDHNTGFIVEKNKNGRAIKAYELPGLWNGAMANWITIFVEVPLITFNPVKTVNDLLKPAHQPQ